MRAYWVRILFGAMLVFLVGYAGIWFGRTRIAPSARSLAHTAESIRIPLAFLPFHIDGERHGTYQRVVIDRSSPRGIRGFNVRVRLADSIDPESLSLCRLTPGSGGEVDLAAGFRCLDPEESDSGLVPFGEVLLAGAGTQLVAVPLLLPESAVRELRRGEQGLDRTQRDVVAAEAAAARAAADSGGSP